MLVFTIADYHLMTAIYQGEKFGGCCSSGDTLRPGGRLFGSTFGIRAGRNKVVGFTLIEVMVVVAIMAILLAVAVPSFVALIARNRVATEINALATDLQYARSIAIKAGQSVTICASFNLSTCDTSKGIWSGGWIVFSDANGNKVVDADDMVRKVQQAFVGTDVLTTSISSISFSREGFALGLASDVVLTLHTVPNSPDATRCLVINVVGHQHVQTKDSNPGTCK